MAQQKMVQVVATDVGYDGLCIRNPGDVFLMPADSFDVHKANHVRRMKVYEKLLLDGKEAFMPSNDPLWFRPANKEETDLA